MMSKSYSSFLSKSKPNIQSEAWSILYDGEICFCGVGKFTWKVSGD